MIQAKNLTEVTLASGNINSSQTTIPLESGAGADLPATSSGWYEGVVWVLDELSPVAAYKAGKAEVVLIKSHDDSSDTVATVTRAQGGTSAVDFSSYGECRLTIDFTKTLFDHLNASSLELHQGIASIGNAAPANVDSFACYPVGNYGQTTAISFVKDVLMAVPDFEVAGTILRGLKMRKNTGANNLCARIGIYSNTTLSGNYYPGTLLAEIEFSNDNDVTPIITNADTGTTDIISSDLPYTFQSSGIFWYAIVTTDGTVGSIAGLSPISLLVLDGLGVAGRNYLGWVHHSSTKLGPIYGYEHAYTYAALPASFPSSSPGRMCAGETRTSFPYMTKIYQALS